ncbi:DUF305 domain-containing protein [Paractinoplanes abujensis]|uniref:Uncharacterized protein (DUF305 family) n=1 Tax=Paractinoplanes abujensis TaxID=882441 RepID=A0A7W7G000_9ACTN|nr:DUF305 domain-containing protein [Actinoplanes abujensis]MBB4690610.1 uncharacterized protein (DUF305 family) [Actinoplanes abujensis]GID17976.1 DUF305 domain-containing protein [Actinoplanes abujensis]
MGRRLAAAVLAVTVLVSGCTAQPETPAPAFNATDVMFLQMALTQIDEGAPVAELAGQRATDPRLRTLATELLTQWREESGPMQRWLVGWQQPREANPSAGAHAGHGDLHSLRESDVGELKAATGTTFDRTAVSLLLGHLGNCVETARMGATGGAYPPARTMGETVTQRRQAQIQTLLRMAA